MQRSHYLKAFTIEEKPGHRLLFSTRNAATLLVPEKTWHSLENGTLSSVDAAILSKHGMLVENRTLEKQSMRGLLDALNQRNTGLRITVILNLDCNFDCRYCYEGGMKGHLYMSQQTSDDLIGFVQQRFTEGKNLLRVDFHGGEPLLSIDRIQYISRALKSFIESRGASYRFSLVTNGSLLSRKIAQELVPLGLKRAKITLDGPADNHNRYRPFKSGAASFESIVRNIQATCDLINISIGGNYEQNNYHRFPLLLEDLAARGLTPDKISLVKFDPVITSPQNNTSTARYRSGCLSIDEPWLAEAEAFLREAVLKRGYNTLKLRPMTCMIENKEAYVVNFDGTLYKCPAFVGREGFAAGTVQGGVLDYADAYRLGNWKNSARCAECEYLPLCFGGCRYMTWVKDGHLDALNCKKSYFDAALETLIKQNIRYRQTAAMG